MGAAAAVPTPAGILEGSNGAGSDLPLIDLQFRKKMDVDFVLPRASSAPAATSSILLNTPELSRLFACDLAVILRYGRYCKAFTHVLGK